jgi:hypothetical protein
VQRWRILNATVSDSSISTWTGTGSCRSPLTAIRSSVPWSSTRSTSRPAFVDEPAYRDTVSISPLGGSITFRTLFADFPGRSVFHCHIVPHSDLGMMGVFEVRRSGQAGGHHRIAARVPPLSRA